MDDKLFAFLAREKLRENYDNVPFDRDEVSEDLIPEDDESESWDRE